jgi:hypothetical protein
MTLKHDPLTGKRPIGIAWPEAFDEFIDYPAGHDDVPDAIQRAFSLLIPEEKKYAYEGHYGDDAHAQIERMIESNSVLAEYTRLF